MDRWVCSYFITHTPTPDFFLLTSLLIKVSYCFTRLLNATINKNILHETIF